MTISIHFDQLLSDLNMAQEGSKMGSETMIKHVPILQQKLLHTLSLDQGWHIGLLIYQLTLKPYPGVFWDPGQLGWLIVGSNYFKVDPKSESESEYQGGIGIGAGTIRNRPSLDPVCEEIFMIEERLLGS